MNANHRHRKRQLCEPVRDALLLATCLQMSCFQRKWVCEDLGPKVIFPPHTPLPSSNLPPSRNYPGLFKKKLFFHTKLWWNLEGRKYIYTFFSFYKKLLSLKLMIYSSWKPLSLKHKCFIFFSFLIGHLQMENFSSAFSSDFYWSSLSTVLTPPISQDRLEADRGSLALGNKRRRE